MNSQNSSQGVALTDEQIAHFIRKGWVTVDLFNAEEIATYRECIETHSRTIVDAGNQQILTFYNNIYNLETPRDLHMFHEPLAQMFQSRNLIDKLTQLAGPDLLLWYTNIFCKLQGQGEIKWHQAIEYYTSSDVDFTKKTLVYDPEDTPVNLTVWVAIDDADRENGGMRFANGSQHTKFEMIPGANPASKGIFSGIGAHATVWQNKNLYSFDYKFDENDWETEFVPLKSGQAIIFTERTMHCSPPNLSARRRMGIIGRYVRPSTQIYPGRLSGNMIDENGHNISRHFNILVAGQDNYHRNVIRSNNDLTEIESTFATMYNRVRFSLVKIPEDKLQLQLCALERQVMEGDCTDEEPNPMLYPKKYVQWLNWFQLTGISQAQAMQRYSELVARFAPNPVEQADAGARRAGHGKAKPVDQTAVESWLIAHLTGALQLSAQEIEMDVPLTRYGLSSLDMVRITGDLSDWMEIELSPSLVYDYPTIESLARHLATAPRSREAELV